MAAIDASQLLRPGLLQGVSILLAGAAGSDPGADKGAACAGLGEAVASECAELGACVFACELGADGADGQEQTAVERAAQQAVDRALADAGGLGLLAIDAASMFAQALAHAGAGTGAGADGAREALRACLDASWNVTRTVAAAAFLPDERGGRIVYLAPPASSGEHADAARAGLENLARTLSIEWARHGITTVAIAPGEATPAGEVAALVAYLASPAGAYFSGCLLDLRGPAGR